MIRKVVEWLLIAIVLAGGVMAWRTGQDRSRLGAEYARLVKSAGDLTITDPDKIHILALETGEPLHFAWRVYMPPHAKVKVRSRAGPSGGSSSANGQAGEFICRVRFRALPNEVGLQVYERFGAGASTNSFGDERLARVLQGHEGELRVEQLGAGRVAVIDPDQTSVLLRVSLPESLRAKAREALGPGDIEIYLPDLFLLEIGPETPKAVPTPPPGQPGSPAR